MTIILHGFYGIFGRDPANKKMCELTLNASKLGILIKEFKIKSSLSTILIYIKF